jgi:two-component system chemotaxis response regulator CheY
MNLFKVLVVDDSAALQQVYKITLSRYNCQTIPALSGQEGLNSLAGNPDINLLIVDINMPHMNGFEFIKKVKEQEAYSNIPLIIVSTKGKEDDAKEALAFAQGNLIKPFISNEVHTLIESLFPQTAFAKPKKSLSAQFRSSPHGQLARSMRL